MNIDISDVYVDWGSEENKDRIITNFVLYIILWDTLKGQSKEDAIKTLEMLITVLRERKDEGEEVEE